MPFTPATLADLLDTLDATTTHVSLHTADPGSTGASEVAGGSYARQALDWSPASGSTKAAAQVMFQVPGSTTITHYGLWSAASGGTFRGGTELDAPETFVLAGPYALIPVASADAISALATTGGTMSGGIAMDGNEITGLPSLDLADDTAGSLTIGTTTVEPAASITHLVDVRSGDGAVGGAYFKHLPADGTATAHALNANQTATSGTGSGLNVASSNRDISAVQIRGSEDDTGTIKATHVNASGTATGDAGSAALSLDLQHGSSGGTRAHGIFVTSTSGGTTGQLMLLRNGGGDLATVGPGGDLHVASRALGDYHPADHGLAAWAYDPASAVNTTVVTNGTVYLVKMTVPRSVTVTRILWHVGVAAATPTAGQNHLGLYNSAGTRLATAGVDGDITSTGLKSTTITGQAVTAGDYWVGLVFNAATPPGLARTTGLAGSAGLINAGLSAAGYRFATNGAGQTALPASLTPGSNAQGIPLWAAIGP
jgi:hypothetical protein